MSKYTFESCLTLTADGDVDYLRTTAEQVSRILPPLIKLVQEIPEEAPEINPNKLSVAFYEDLDFDSIDKIFIIMDVEEYFTIEIQDEEADKVKTVSDLLSLIVSKL